MRVPQVSERIKEAPAQALRGVFAGIGQLLLITDKIRNKAPAYAGPVRPRTPAPPEKETVAGPAAAPREEAAAPVPAEPVHAEPVHAEPVQAEPVRAEPVPARRPAASMQAEPVHAEPVPTEPSQAAPVQAAPRRRLGHRRRLRSGTSTRRVTSG